MTTGERQFAPATQRNRVPILAVLQQVLPKAGTVLEVASGTGEHAVYFSRQMSHLNWLPSDPNPSARASITAWREESGIAALYPPVDLDARQKRWPVEFLGRDSGSDSVPDPIAAIININMIHISPWEACLGLLAGAGRILSEGGVLYLYGPYQRNGQHTAPSNAAFDMSLRSQHPTWGVRHLEDVVTAAEAEGLGLQQLVEMPANNMSVIFHKS
ncbi:MAG: DUF938 domain-containing protein [Cyanobacteria bacterium P01_E01_bin.34]